MSKYLDENGLLYLWSKIKAWVNNQGFITSSDIPEGAAASTVTPTMDGTASKGTDNGFARGDHVHPTDTSRVEANNPITGATKTKITYDSKGLVTAGADLQASDIPNLTLSKISDVTATAAELNIMDGVTASTAELNYVDGVTSSIQTQLNSKADVSSSVSTIAYGSNKITKTINNTTTDVVTAATIVTDGGGILSSTIGAASGVCPLDSNQKVPAANLPSYVDDVVEAYPRTGQTRLSSTWLATGSASGTVITPESGVIYVLMTAVTFTDPDASSSHSTDTITWPAGTEFRWGGTSYVKINDGGLSSMTNTEMDTATNNWT